MDRRFLLFAFASIVACAAFACGEDDQITALSVDIRGPNDDPANDIYAFPDPDWQNIRNVRVTVLQGREVIARETYDYDNLAGRLPTLPFGEDFLLAVEGLDASEKVVASGASQRFDLTSDADPPQVQVFTARPNQFTPGFRYVTNEVVDASAGSAPFTGSVPAPFELPDARAGAATVTLPDGRIVVIGGARLSVASGVVSFGEFFSTVEIYTPRTGAWYTVTIQGCDIGQLGVQACALRVARPKAFHAAALLPDGRIVVTGGIAPDQDIADTFLTVGDIDVLELTGALEGTVSTVQAVTGSVASRAFHTVTAMADGSLVVVGGIRGVYSSPEYAARIDVITPRPGELPVYESAIGVDGQPVSLAHGRALHQAVNIAEGDHGVLVVGGRDATAPIGQSEVIFRDGVSYGVEQFSARTDSIDLQVPRFGHTALRYQCPNDDGAYVVIVGGYSGVTGPAPLDGGAPTPQLEEYAAPTTLAQPFVINSSPAAAFAVGRAFAQVATFDSSGDVVVVGGIGENGEVMNTGERALLDWSSCSYLLPSTSALDLEAIGAMATGRAFGHAATLDSYFGIFFGGTDGTNAVRVPEFFNPNDYFLFR